MKRLVFAAAVITVSVQAVFAAGITGGDALKINTGATALAMGGAYTSWGSGAEALNYNPAGIAMLKGREFSATYFSFFADTQVANLAYAQELDTFFLEGSIGLSVLYRWIPTIDNEDAADDPVNYNEFIISFTYANTLHYFIKQDIMKNIKIGLSGKMLTEQIGPHTGSTVAFDAGVQFVPEKEGFRAGLSLMNLGPPLRLLRGRAEEGDPEFESSMLPLTLRAGISRDIRIDESNVTRMAVEYIQDFYDYARFGAGIEHDLLNLLFFRLGYNTCVDTRNPSYLSGGAGIYINQMDFKIGINYVYRMVLFGGFDAPESNHAGSVTVKF